MRENSELFNVSVYSFKKGIGRFCHNEIQSRRHWRRHLEYPHVYGEGLVSFAQDHIKLWQYFFTTRLRLLVTPLKLPK